MTPEQIARMTLGWSRERLARESGVSVASIYLLERLQSADPNEDARIREALVFGMVQRWTRSREYFLTTKIGQSSFKIDEYQ